MRGFRNHRGVHAAGRRDLGGLVVLAARSASLARADELLVLSLEQVSLTRCCVRPERVVTSSCCGQIDVLGEVPRVAADSAE